MQSCPHYSSKHGSKSPEHMIGEQLLTSTKHVTVSFLVTTMSMEETQKIINNIHSQDRHTI